MRNSQPFSPQSDRRVDDFKVVPHDGDLALLLWKQMMLATGARKNIADNSEICLLSDRDDIRVTYAVINEVGWWRVMQL